MRRKNTKYKFEIGDKVDYYKETGSWQFKLTGLTILSFDKDIVHLKLSNGTETTRLYAKWLQPTVITRLKRIMK